MPMNLTPAEELGNPKMIKLEENLMFAKQKRDELKNTKLLHLTLLERLMVFYGGAFWGVRRITAMIMILVMVKIMVEK